MFPRPQSGLTTSRGLTKSKPAANLLTRLEYRHDHSNIDTFYGNNDDTGNPTKRDQDTLSLSGVFTF